MGGRPRFKRFYRCEIIPSEGVFLLSEGAQVALRGRAYLHVAPLLDGRRTDEEIADLLGGRASPAEVFYALDQLRGQGYVIDDEPSPAAAPPPPGEAALWEALGARPEAAAAALREAAVSITAIAGVDGRPLEEALGALGIRVAGGGRLGVALTDDYLRRELDDYNRARLSDGAPWLLVKPAGAALWIGPLFVPGRTGCWACLAHRLKGHRKVERYLEARGSRPGPVPAVLPELPSTRQIAAAIAATQIAAHLAAGRREALEGKVVTLDALTLEKRDHVLTRRPQCAACGDPALVGARQASPLRLERRPKGFTSDGGHRAVSPRETLRRLEAQISPITGIVSELRDDAADAGAPGLILSYVADHASLTTGEPLGSVREGLRGRAGGKGRHDVQARVSALAEGIERYSGMFQGDEARVRSSLARLGAAGIHPNACMLFSEAQLRAGRAASAGGPRQAWAPEPLDPDEEIDWSPVWSLSAGERRYAPTALCYFGHAPARGDRFARADSNGCAGGNTLEEAILQGFMELVERDSVALWWYNRLRRPGVDLDSFDEPYFQDLAAHYASIGRDLWVLDLTSDLRVPAVVAGSRRTAGGPEDIVLGFGAHFDARIAVLRALTEVSQQLPAVLPRRGGERAAPAAGEAASFWAGATVAGEPHLSPDEAAAARTPRDFSRLGSDDLYADVMTCVRIAAERGLETLVLDQTRPDAGLHVVKVMVPGLRHFWPRLGPGRLYDVPVQMGWSARPLGEAELNRNPVYR